MLVLVIGIVARKAGFAQRARPLKVTPMARAFCKHAGGFDSGKRSIIARLDTERRLGRCMHVLIPSVITPILGDHR